MMPFASPYGAPLYWSFHERPEAWHVDPFHQYATGLAFFGGGRFTHSTHFHDSRLYGNHGTLTNMDPATDWVRALGRAALSGNGSTNKYVLTGSVPLVAGPYSVSCWCSVSATSTSIRAVWRATNANIHAFGLYHYSDNSIRGYNGSSGVTLFTPALDTWYHISTTQTGAATNPAWYANGISVATGSAKVAAAASFWLLSDEYTPAFNEPLNGGISDFLIHSRALTPSEISALADPGNVMLSLGGSDPGLIVPDDLVYPVYLPSSVVAGAKPALWLGVCV